MSLLNEVEPDGWVTVHARRPGMMCRMQILSSCIDALFLRRATSMVPLSWRKHQTSGADLGPMLGSMFTVSALSDKACRACGQRQGHRRSGHAHSEKALRTREVVLEEACLGSA